MSELGNVNKSFGKQINISVANTYSNNVLNSAVLPKNTLIISSPVDANNNDIGTYCLLITDNNGKAVRLSYTLQTGNGLNVDNLNEDIIKLDIDSSTLHTNINGNLEVNINDIVDNKTISVIDDKLQVNTNGFPIVNNEEKSVVLIDDLTAKISDNGNLYVNVENLDKANEGSYGVITSDNNTVHIDSNGIITVNTNNLEKTSDTTYGVIKVDGTTVESDNGNIYVVTNNLTHCSDSYFGVVKPDNDTVKINNGELFINTQKINKASNLEYGVTKIDGNSLVSTDGVLSMNNYDKIINELEAAVNKLNIIDATIEALNKKISEIG